MKTILCTLIIFSIATIYSQNLEYLKKIDTIYIPYHGKQNKVFYILDFTEKRRKVITYEVIFIGIVQIWNSNLLMKKVPFRILNGTFYLKTI